MGETDRQLLCRNTNDFVNKEGKKWLHLTRTGLLSGEFLDLGFVRTKPFAATRLEAGQPPK
jgi:hypothetical protein